MTRRTDVAERITELEVGLPRYVSLFELERPFGNPVSHLKTLRALRAAGSVRRAVADEIYLKSLWTTLHDWGLNRRASELAPYNDFVAVLRGLVGPMEALEGVRIDRATDEQLDGAWELVEGASGLTTNKAKLVSVTKTLHHLLPDLFVPFDREYTAWFFRWSGPHVQYHQERVFRDTYGAFRLIGTAADLDALLDDDWNSSISKVLDNGVVGFRLAARASAPPERDLDITETQDRLAEFAEERDWGQFHSPKNLAASISVEAGELLEVFQWLSEEQSRALKNPSQERDRVIEELADVLIYALRLADVLDIPLAEAVSGKIDLNETKYPIELAKGNAIKYSQRGDE